MHDYFIPIGAANCHNIHIIRANEPAIKPHIIIANIIPGPGDFIGPDALGVLDTLDTLVVLGVFIRVAEGIIYIYIYIYYLQ
jgi:hypothetical protein